MLICCNKYYIKLRYFKIKCLKKKPFLFALLFSSSENIAKIVEHNKINTIKTTHERTPP